MKTRSTTPQNDWDTNTGWWADKPERPVRPSKITTRNTDPVRLPNVWRDAALIVATMFAFVLSLISLATR